MNKFKIPVMSIAAAVLLCGAAVSLQAQKSQGNYRRAAALPQKANTEPIMVEVATAAGTAIDLTYSLPDAGIKATGTQYGGANLSEVDVGNALQSGNEGEPVLPVIPVQVVIPAGYSLENVRVVATKTQEMKGTYRIRHGEAKIPLVPGAKQRKATPLSRIYDSDNTYPSSIVELVGVQYKRGVAIAFLKVHPVAYRPKSGKISACTSVSFELKTKKDGSRSPLKSRPNALNKASLQVENPEALGTYEEGSTAPLDSGSVSPLGICDPAQSYRYVLVTADSLRAATTDYTVRDLIAQKQARGLSATIVTIEDVLANYSGVDNAERLRNFIIDAYSNWETDFVLLGGDINIIPMRKLYCYAGGETDQIPSDLYYQCLDGNYNSDNDTYWGEPTDGPGGTDVDLMAEVYIGRASAENKAEMSNFVYKTLAYENAAESSSYLRRALMVGEYLGFGGVSDYATASMEEIRLGSSASGYTTAGFASSALFSVDTLYDRSGYSWPASDILSRMSSGVYGIYNHLGHANYNYVMKFYNADADALTNNNYFFAYSQGCIPGNFEADCIAEHLTTSTRHGAYAVVFNARYGWGQFNSTDGPSQRFDRQFWDAYFGEFMSNLGALNADSHEDNIWDINGDCIRWCFYESNLLGDPQTPVRGRVVGPSLAYSSHTVSDATGGNGDGLVNPGETIDITLTVANVGTDSAVGVVATVSSTDPYVTMVNGSASFGTIQCCGATRTAAGPVRLTVSSSCPTPRTITLSCLLRDSRDSTWTSTFTLSAYTSSQVSGYVRTMTGGNPISGATVSFSGPISGSVTTNSSGAYMFGGIDGTYSVSANAAGYAPSTVQSVTVPPSVANVNFALGRAHITVTPASISRTVIIGDSTQASLAVQNSGDLPLYITSNADKTALGTWAPASLSYDSTHFIHLDKGATDTRLGEPQKLTKGGPDSAGYRWVDSREAGGPAYVWNDITSTGRLLSTVSGCDDCYETATLSFPFPFYGNTFSSCYVSSNGYVTFGTASSQYANYALPSTSMPANLIAGFFDDLYPSTAGDIYFQDFGDRAVIQFNGVSIGSSTTYTCTFQMVLNRSGAINLYYRRITGSQTGCTVGIQNGTRTVGLNVVYNASYLVDSLAIEFRSTPAWLSVAPLRDTVNPGQTKQLSVMLNSSGLNGGMQTGAVMIAHNAPQTSSPLSVPCTLVVDGMRRLSITPQTVDFGSCWVGQRDTAVLTLTNSGDEATTVSSVTSTNGYFSAIASLPLTVPAFGNTTLRVVYQPGTLGSHSGTLTVNSNAEDNPAINVSLQGSGIEGPQINIAPSAINVSLNAGDSSFQTVDLSNSGGADLYFDITAEEIGTNPFGKKDILIIGDGGTEIRLDSLLRSVGFTTTIVTDDAIYNGNNPSPDGFGAIVLTDGTNYGSDMPSAGQNAIVQFVQNGGGLVTTEWIGYEIESGRYSVLRSIIPFTRTSGSSGTETYTVIKQHPISEGVDINFSVTTSTSIGVVNAGEAIINGSVAGAALVAASFGNGRVVSFASAGKYSPYDAFSNQNMQKLMVNAVKWTGASSIQWLSVDRDTGTVFPGSSVQIHVAFRSADLIGGDYAGILNVKHNAPGSPSPAAIPCTLSVDGFRRLSASPSSLNFGPLWVGLRDTMSLTLANSGNEATLVSSISSSHAAFTALASLPLTVPPFEAVIVPIVYQPGTVGSHSGTLTVNSNAEDNPVIAITVSGEGTTPPGISVSPSSLSSILNPGDSAFYNLTISNTGGADLSFSITGAQSSSPETYQLPRALKDYSLPEYHLHVSAGIDAGQSDIPERDITMAPLSVRALDLTNITIAVDAYHGARDSSSFVTALGDCKARGAFVFRNINPITSAMLDTVDLLWFGDYPTMAFTPAESLAIDSWLKQGGSIFVQSDEPTYYVNLLQSYGITHISGGYSGTSTNIVPHPATDSVSSVYIGSPVSYLSLSGTGQTVVFDINNLPHACVAEVERGRIFVASDEDFESSGIGYADNRKFANKAVDWLVARNLQWLSWDTQSGVVSAGGGSRTIGVGFLAGDLLGGNYTGELRITHNAPGSSSPLVVPCTLTVNGFRSLTASPSSIVFDPLWAGSRDTAFITLSNTGNEPTQVSSVASSNAAFYTPATTPFIVEPSMTVQIPVIFIPLSAGNYSGALTIISNAEDNPSITVSLSGTAISGPAIAVSPQQVSVSLAVGESAQRTVTLANSGGDDLIWSLSQGSGGMVSRETHDTIPGVQSVSYTALHDLTFDYWSDAGNDAFDGFGYPSVAVGGVSSRVSMLEGDFSYTINGYNVRVRNDFAENHIYRSIIEPQPGESSSRSDITVNLTGNMGSDGSETVYVDSVQVAGRWLRFYVNEVSFPNSDPRVVFLIVPSNIQQRDSVRYWQPSSGYVSMEARNISLPATVYIIPSYHALTSIKAWFQNDIVLRNNWLSVSPNSGTTPGGQISNLLFSFNTAGMQTGTYYDTIKVMHNVPSQISPLGIPVTLQVGENIPGMTGSILSIGVSAVPVTSGSRFRVIDLRIGSPVAGLAQGSRYRAVLR